MKERLFTPGPTMVPEEVLLEMAKPVVHHRSEEFGRLFAQVQEDLKYLFQTENPVLILTSSGTGAMEAAVANLLSREDTALVVRGGKFGERWGEICEAYGVRYVAVDVEWGHAVDPEDVRKALREHPEVRAVLATQSETSTGVLHDVKALAEVAREADALLVVDAISSLGAHPLPMDEWGVDVVLTGSQKGLMLPPGLAFISLSERAWKATERSDLPKYYWDLAKARSSLSKGQTPYTPAVSLVVGLARSLKILREVGLESLWRRHARHAEATRRAVGALGLELFSHSPSNVLTIVKVPDGVDGKALLKSARAYGATFAGGQEKLSGKVVRITHLGYMDDFDTLSAVAALERALRDVGYDVPLGKGVAAAQEVLSEG